MQQSFLTIILNLLENLLKSPQQNAPKNPPKSQVPETPKEEEPKKVEIDWTDPKAKISKYFTVKEALYLPSWNVLHIPSEEEKENIVKMAEKMDLIREELKSPISIHVWIRPVLNQPDNIRHGQDYNAFIKGAKKSAHKIGQGVDWSCSGKTCDEVRELLKGKLEEFDIRMEDIKGANWVHVDMMKPFNNVRFFKP